MQSFRQLSATTSAACTKYRYVFFNRQKYSLNKEIDVMSLPGVYADTLTTIWGFTSLNLSLKSTLHFVVFQLRLHVHDVTWVLWVFSACSSTYQAETIFFVLSGWSSTVIGFMPLAVKITEWLPSSVTPIVGIFGTSHGLTYCPSLMMTRHLKRASYTHVTNTPYSHASISASARLTRCKCNQLKTDFMDFI